MSKPITFEDFLQTRSNYGNHKLIDDFCIVIDDFYENPDDIHHYLSNRDHFRWKYDPESGTRNGIDYDDCRVIDKNAWPSRKYCAEEDRLKNLCNQYFWKHDYAVDPVFEVNCFRTRTVFDNKLQHYPHCDSAFTNPDDCATLNMLVYLDKQESGGTAVYGGRQIENFENINVLYPVESEFEMTSIIEHKYNRCVIFPGNRLHGAYINDYTKYCDDNWRYTQVKFFHPIDRNGNMVARAY